MEATDQKMPAVPTLVPPPPSLAKLGAALAKAQGQMANAKKDTENPYFSSRYADLASIWDVIRKPLSDNGLCIIQQATTDKGTVTVHTTLLHESGEKISDTLVLPVAQPTPQGYGSAITYARRYSLSAMVGVAAEADDDGNAASHAKSPATQKYEQKKAQQSAPERKMPPIKEEPSASVDYYKRIKAALEKYELRGKPALDFVQRVTGKAKVAEFAENDVGLIESALAAEYAKQPAHEEDVPQ